MTRSAIALDLAAVRITGPMASCTILGQRLFRNDRRVTRITGNLRMRLAQGKFGAVSVIVGDRLPLLIVVAIVTFLPETPGVRIVCLVTAVAILWDLILVVAASVTRKTINIRVHPKQRVAGFLQVIVFCALPSVGEVALAAVIAARAAMLIVGRVTTDTRFRSLLVVPTHVTGIAQNGAMSACQFEVGLVVVELPARPTR